MSSYLVYYFLGILQYAKFLAFDDDFKFTCTGTYVYLYNYIATSIFYFMYYYGSQSDMPEMVEELTLKKLQNL